MPSSPGGPRRRRPATTATPNESAPPRALPDAPSLEFEHKRAKKLLGRLRTRDEIAIARASATIGPRTQQIAADFQLSDAQFVIAREYGFASWPKLVECFGFWERERAEAHPPVSVMLEGAVTDIPILIRRVRAELSRTMDRHGTWTLAAYVPRFYSRAIEDIRPDDVTDDEIRYAYARSRRFMSWNDLVRTSRTAPVTEAPSPARLAMQAISNLDLESLEPLIGAHPELLELGAQQSPQPGGSLLYHALSQEVRERSIETRRVSDWLIARGANLSAAINPMLQMLRPEASDVQYLLDRGADPSWISPAGVTILEYALISYWSRKAVDVVATRVTPPNEFWMAAALGNVQALSSWFAPDGSLNEAARRVRVPWHYIDRGRQARPLPPPVNEMGVMAEALVVAGLNERWNVVEFLRDRGVPIDVTVNGMSLLHLATGNVLVPHVEALLARGANPDAPTHNGSARSLSQSRLSSAPWDVRGRRVAELIETR